MDEKVMTLPMVSDTARTEGRLQHVTDAKQESSMITETELKEVKAPFEVKSVHDGRVATIEGFSENDPLGVGGTMGIIPPMATAYFQGGGWCLVADLMKHWDIASTQDDNTWNAAIEAAAQRAESEPHDQNEHDVITISRCIALGIRALKRIPRS